MMEYLQLFWAFIKVGAFTFGGGYAMLPILQKEIVEKYGWVTDAEVMDYYAMGQCLPGIIMVNTSAFIGRRKKGVAGGIIAAVAAVLPSLVIITVIAACLTAFADVPMVKNAFAGIRVCVVVLIINAVAKLWKTAIIDWKCLGIFLAVCLLSVFTNVSPVVFVLAAAAAGIAVSCLGTPKEAKGK
ncbi:MAG: chromate transporter [Oscillospiraceae bacterium]